MSEDPPRPSAAQRPPAPAPKPAPGLAVTPHAPSLEEELAVLAFLECSHQLAPETTGYITEALLQWAVFEPTVSPDPMPPRDGGLTHPEVLEQITARWSDRSQTAASVASKLALGRIGRQLTLAVQCQRDPQRLSEALWREEVQRMPWLATPLPPLRYPDGSVL